ncbi:MAG TPA: Lsr2 family protein [Micromonosporaceae bacterium]
MAKQLVISYSSDISGEEAAETVHFAVDGRGYEVDLTEKEAMELREFLDQYIAVGRKPAKSQPGSSRGSTNKEELAAIRQWASRQGIEVATRGRISNAVIEDWKAAGSPTTFPEQPRSRGRRSRAA